ncbi:MAG: aromatic acid exporter family protein [Acholeplasma sp.]|nr:aromatic acid exporter family protein [Acholeplasma sp.]
MKPWMIQALKMVFGAFIAIELAELLNLSYSVTAGVIVILSIQKTKRQSFRIALKRLIASLVGLFISVVIFYFLGFELYAFILALFVFVPLAFYLKVDDGIVVTTVLMSHVLLGASLMLSINAIYLLIIGVSIALLINLYMPSFQKRITLEISSIDQALKDSIEQITKEVKPDFSALSDLIDKAIKRIKRESENKLFSPKDMNIEYVIMRKEQLRVLKEIQTDLFKVKVTAFKKIILDFLCKVKLGIGKDNMALPLLEDLEHLKSDFKRKPLPISREEFEERALLYHILHDLEQFLQAKIAYHQLIEKIG